MNRVVCVSGIRIRLNPEVLDFLVGEKSGDVATSVDKGAGGRGARD